VSSLRKTYGKAVGKDDGQKGLNNSQPLPGFVSSLGPAIRRLKPTAIHGRPRWGRKIIWNASYFPQIKS